ncbi:hypothetical protein [Winogradskyella sp.]|uniref:hypothetical protein n=1 Tax=Winogradskyella sp. TaxID=1883156 RepID=UPI003F6AB9DD
MGKLNQDFRYNRAFDLITLIAFIIFLVFFAQSVIAVMGAFETEVYSNTIADLGQINN